MKINTHILFILVFCCIICFEGFSQSKRVNIIAGVAFRGVPVNFGNLGNRLHNYNFDFTELDQFKTNSISVDISKPILDKKFS